MYQFWRLREYSHDNRGLACTDDGLLLGHTSLVERRAGRFVVRDRGEIERLLKRVYHGELPVDRLMRGLAAIAAALNANDQCLARIAAVHLKIPDLPSPAARDALAAEDSLIKYARGESGGADWNPALHPRTGAPPNPGWFAPTDGASPNASPVQTAQTYNPTWRPASASQIIPINDNQRANKQVRDVATALGLNKSQRQQLHREISGMEYSYREILQIAIDMFGK